MNNLRGFSSIIVLIAIVLVIVFVALMSDSLSNRPLTVDVGNLATSIGESEDCQVYGPLEIDQFLAEYVVVSGDTLLSVATKELADVSRASEIASLNRYLKRFPELSLTNPFLEVGWKLFLPPKNVKQTSGNIQAYAGRLTEINNPDFVIDFNGMGGGRVRIDNNTQFLLKPYEEYSIGDCLFQIEDVRTTGVRALYVLPLTDEAIFNFRTISSNVN